MNATEKKQGLHVEVRGMEDMKIHTNDELTVGAIESRWVPVKVGVPYENLKPGSYPIWFDVSNDDGSLHATEKAVFLVPH
jgi:hypothetical protein